MSIRPMATPFTLFARRLCTAPPKSSRWERIRNSKAGVWCRSLLSDYREACRDVVLGALERPVKASLYTALAGGAWACFHTKPDLASFETSVLESSRQLGLLSPWVRSATSDGHVQNLLRLHNQGQLRHASLGLLTLIYQADYDSDAVLYEAQCSNLSVPWGDLPQRILDVGFAGQWWLLQHKMKDYDINNEEFRHLPAHMRETLPPAAADVEKNETLHKQSWLALEVKEDEDVNAAPKQQQ